MSPFRTFAEIFELVLGLLGNIAYICTARRIVGSAEVRPMNVTSDAQASGALRFNPRGAVLFTIIGPNYRFYCA